MSVKFTQVTLTTWLANPAGVRPNAVPFKLNYSFSGRLRVSLLQLFFLLFFSLTGS